MPRKPLGKPKVTSPRFDVYLGGTSIFCGAVGRWDVWILHMFSNPRGHPERWYMLCKARNCVYEYPQFITFDQQVAYGTLLTLGRAYPRERAIVYTKCFPLALEAFSRWMEKHNGQ